MNITFFRKYKHTHSNICPSLLIRRLYLILAKRLRNVRDFICQVSFNDMCSDRKYVQFANPFNMNGKIRKIMAPNYLFWWDWSSKTLARVSATRNARDWHMHSSKRTCLPGKTPGCANRLFYRPFLPLRVCNLDINRSSYGVTFFAFSSICISYFPGIGCVATCFGAKVCRIHTLVYNTCFFLLIRVISQYNSLVILPH